MTYYHHRRCLVFSVSCSDSGWAMEGRSRCRFHNGSAWRGVPPERKIAYLGDWARLRKVAIEREPRCHWGFVECTGVSTVADHLVGVSKGGASDLSNLVGSCQHCNLVRAGRDAAAEAARRRRRRNA